MNENSSQIILESGNPRQKYKQTEPHTYHYKQTKKAVQI